jgi:hypothetical protein
LRDDPIAILPRFVPLQRFPNHTEPHTPETTHGSGYVSSSGFRTLLTLCSPRDLPSLFHPGTTLGVHPSRPSSSDDAVCSLEHRGLLEVLAKFLNHPKIVHLFCPPLQGLAHHRKRHCGFEVSRVPHSACLLEFGSFKASCSTQPPAYSDRCSPLVLFRFDRKLTASLAPQGFF